jgi:hypothetical protein
MPIRATQMDHRSRSAVQSSPLNCCWLSPAHSFLFSGPMTEFLFVPRPFMSLEMGSPLPWREDLVLLCRRLICCAIISNQCTRAHEASRLRTCVLYGHHTRFVTSLQWITFMQDMKVRVCEFITILWNNSATRGGPSFDYSYCYIIYLSCLCYSSITRYSVSCYATETLKRETQVY